MQHLQLSVKFCHKYWWNRARFRTVCPHFESQMFPVMFSTVFSLIIKPEWIHCSSCYHSNEQTSLWSFTLIRSKDLTGSLEPRNSVGVDGSTPTLCLCVQTTNRMGGTSTVPPSQCQSRWCPPITPEPIWSGWGHGHRANHLLKGKAATEQALCLRVFFILNWEMRRCNRVWTRFNWDTSRWRTENEIQDEIEY